MYAQTFTTIAVTDRRLIKGKTWKWGYIYTEISLLFIRWVSRHYDHKRILGYRTKYFLWIDTIVYRKNEDLSFNTRLSASIALLKYTSEGVTT